jgi:hypothetical protein
VTVSRRAGCPPSAGLKTPVILINRGTDTAGGEPGDWADWAWRLQGNTRTTMTSASVAVNVRIKVPFADPRRVVALQAE